jgi:hypothetical protein
MPDQGQPKEKTVADLGKEERDTVWTAEAAQDFINSRFGKGFLLVLDHHIALKENELYSPHEPGSGFDGLGYSLRAESSKGTIMGLRLTKTLLFGMVEAGKQVKRSRGIGTAGDKS